MVSVGQSPPGRCSRGHLRVTVTTPPDLGRISLLIRQLCVWYSRMINMLHRDLMLLQKITPRNKRFICFHTNERPFCLDPALNNSRLKLIIRFCSLFYYFINHLVHKVEVPQYSWQLWHYKMENWWCVNYTWRQRRCFGLLHLLLWLHLVSLWTEWLTIICLSKHILFSFLSRLQTLFLPPSTHILRVINLPKKRQNTK